MNRIPCDSLAPYARCGSRGSFTVPYVRIGSHLPSICKIVQLAYFMLYYYYSRRAKTGEN